MSLNAIINRNQRILFFIAKRSSHSNRIQENSNSQIKKIYIIDHNIQSIGNYVDEFNVFLNHHPTCTILAITEHWKSESRLEYHDIKQFKLVSAYCRPENVYGGAAVYCRQPTNGKARKEINNILVLG